MSGALKKTTGLTGLKVLKRPREELMSAYRNILKTIKEMPEDAAYKRYTAATVNQRLQIVQNNTDLAAIEKQINCGQCEELLVQAQNELSLARRFLADKPWEPMPRPPPENQWKWPV